MSSVTVEINGRETVSQAALQASGSVKKMSDDSKSFLKDIQVTAGDLVGAIQGIASTVGEFFTEYAAQQKSILTFNAAISQSAQLTDGSSDRLKEYAGAMALKTGADDDAILSMVAFLATAGRTEEQIRKVISAAADMSVVTGKDLRGSVEDINKTFSGSEGRMGQVVLGLQNLLQVRGNGLRHHGAQIELQAAAQNGDGDFLRVGCGEHEFEVFGRLFQRLQHGVKRRVGEHVHLVDHEDLEAPLHRLVHRLLQQALHLVHPAVGGSVQLDIVGKASAINFCARRANTARRSGDRALPIRPCAVE